MALILIWIWIGFGFDLYLDLALIWIWFGFGLILVGFGLIRLGFWSIIAFIARTALQGGPREAPSGIRRSSLGKATRVTRATEVIKCIIECRIDHLASWE